MRTGLFLCVRVGVAGWRCAYPAYEVHLLLSALACFAGWRCAYPAYDVRTSGFRRRPALPDGGDALSGLRRASSACEMTEVAVKRRPDKRSAIRQKCAAQKKPRHWRGSL